MTAPDIQPGPVRTERPHEARSVPDLLRDLVFQTSDLVRQEIALARAEMSSKVSNLSTGLVTLGIGAVLTLAGLIVLLDAAVYALVGTMPPWAAALLVGGVVVIIGLLFLLSGQSELSARNLMPKRTARTMRETTRVGRRHEHE